MFVVYCFEKWSSKEMEEELKTVQTWTNVVQGKYERRKEGVSEEMEVEAGKLEQAVEEDFGAGRFAR